MANWLKRALETLGGIFPEAIFYQPTQAPTVALTIDDVPVPGESTPCPTRRILDAIANHNQSLSNPTANVRATFFVIGSHLNGDHHLLTDMVAQGHELANHGMVDTWPARQSRSQFEHHFYAAHARLVEQVPHQTIRWYRPGRAFYTPHMYELVCQADGYEPYFALASMLPLDTISAISNPAFTAEYVMRHIFPGAILLLHGGSVERSKNSAAALRLILPRLHSQGYRVTTLSDLWLSTPDTTADC
ncbi:MAG: polysaccharide deacetylase family protein [Leptolyngbyaceae cyanobacterium]